MIPNLVQLNFSSMYYFLSPRPAHERPRYGDFRHLFRAHYYAEIALGQAQRQDPDGGWHLQPITSPSGVFNGWYVVDDYGLCL